MDSMPEPPKAALHAISMLEDPNVSVALISEFISLDQSLTTKVLKLSNRANYGSRKVATVKDALVRIGTDDIKSLLYSSILQFSGIKTNPFFMELWKSALFTAFVAKEMGSLLHHSRSDLCFTGGLLCDIGQLLMNEFNTEVYTKLVKEVRRTKVNILEAENQVFGFTHIQVGYKVASTWNLPVMYRNAIRHHHNPLAMQHKVSEEQYKLIVAIHVANTLSPLFNKEQDGREISWPAIRRAGLYQISREDLLDSLQQKFSLYYQYIAYITEAMFGEDS